MRIYMCTKDIYVYLSPHMYVMYKCVCVYLIYMQTLNIYIYIYVYIYVCMCTNNRAPISCSS
nr:MAG TPA: hypothetical protein [Caudoviricetes sp.]